jgi:hypothetical protein
LDERRGYVVFPLLVISGRRRWSSLQKINNNFWNSVVGIIDSDVDQELHTKWSQRRYSSPNPERNRVRWGRGGFI